MGGALRTGLGQGSDVQGLAVALAAVGWEDADDEGDGGVGGQGTDCGAADEGGVEVGDLQQVVLGSLAYLLQGEGVTGDDGVVDELPVLEGGVVVGLLDPEVGLISRRSWC